MSFPGQQYHNQQGGQYPNQYGQPPPQQHSPQYAPQQQYGGPPQGGNYGPQLQPQYGGYGAPPPQQGYGPPPGNYGYPPPGQSPGYGPPPGSSPGGYGPPPGSPGYAHPGPTPQSYGLPSPQPLQQGYGYQQAPPGRWAPPGGAQGAPPPPPSQMQSFGHGAPQDYSFQYSMCTGKRKALVIGINYIGSSSKLAGCINDATNMSNYLSQHFGYQKDDMVILTDDQRDPRGIPTRANIIRAMQWLVMDARQNDSLFFHYSGHGGQTEDLDGDEDDGYDEVIYPVDYKQAGHIVDDEMHHIMVRSLPPGVRLTAIFDSCHSGSALDLPFIYSTQGVLKEPNLAKEAGQGLLGMVTSYAKGDLGGMASTAMGLFKKVTSGDDTYKRNQQTKTSPADVIMWSGSKDDQTSADASIAGNATGAMSWAFIAALRKNSQQSYVQLLNSIRDELEGKYSQKPQLSCSHPMNTNLMFVM